MVEKSAIKKLSSWIKDSARITFLTGAGISTESGIPDFRSPGGLYSDPDNASIFDISSFRRDPSPFFRFASRFLLLCDQACPNRAHQAISALEKNKPVTIVTQNIDGLHQAAGSRKVCSVHGDFSESICLGCGMKVSTLELKETILAGRVPFHVCGGVFKPAVTFFGESLPADQWEKAVQAVQTSDLLIVVGSSLVVYPAAGLPDLKKQDCRLVIINREPTVRDQEADLVIHGGAGDVLGEIIG